MHIVKWENTSLHVHKISCNRDSGRCPKLKKKDSLAELHYNAAPASTVIRQFSK